jgi:hypothetical protein
MKAIPPEFFRQMLDDAALAGHEAAERVAKALDPGYWSTLTGVPGPLPGATSASGVAAAVEDFKPLGVYHVRGALGDATVDRLNQTIDAVVGAGWPGVFAFACDELWACARLEPIRALVTGALGEGARQIPHVWTHIVRPKGESAGWSPHIDGPGNDRMTVWIALTDAGLDNGCMYAVPRDAGVAEAVQQWSAQDSLTKLNVQRLLQAAKPMPAAAGDLLGWAFDIVHWGGRVSEGAPGRRSVSLEFIAPHAQPGPTDFPLVPLTGPLPPHGERLRAVASAILEYKKFEPLLLRYQGVATRILEAVDQAGTKTMNGS